MTFDEQLQQAMQDSLLKLIRSGEWCKLDYSAKVPLDAAFIRRLQASVDMEKVLTRVAEHVEGRIADAIFNAMATEINSDVKKILSNTELREDIRAVVREKIRAVRMALTKEGA